MQLNPRNQRLRPKPTRRERRRIRRSPGYSEIRSRLGITDAQTLLLLQVGDLQLAHVGQDVIGRQWSESHVLIGLAPRLRVSNSSEISAPWMVHDNDLETQVTIASPGSVLFVHRRHLPLVEGMLAGATETVGRLSRAALHRPRQPQSTRPTTTTSQSLGRSPSNPTSQPV